MRKENHSTKCFLIPTKSQALCSLPEIQTQVTHSSTFKGSFYLVERTKERKASHEMRMSRIRRS